MRCHCRKGSHGTAPVGGSPSRSCGPPGMTPNGTPQSNPVLSFPEGRAAAGKGIHDQAQPYGSPSRAPRAGDDTEPNSQSNPTCHSRPERSGGEGNPPPQRHNGSPSRARRAGDDVGSARTQRGADQVRVQPRSGQAEPGSRAGWGCGARPSPAIASPLPNPPHKGSCCRASVVPARRQRQALGNARDRKRATGAPPPPPARERGAPQKSGVAPLPEPLG